MMQGALLEVDAIDAFYGDFQALFGVGLRVHAGEVVALIGANGAGKSTLLKSLLGLVRVAAGAIRFEGDDITRRAPHAAARSGIAMSPEGRRLFASLTVEENLSIGRARRGAGSRWTLARIYELFPILATRRHTPATLLSGGQQQMVAIGRALMLQPTLLLLDEISLGLAPAVVQEVYAQLPTIASTGIGVVLVEQDLERALAASHRALCLREGRVQLEGPSDALARDAIVHAYFG